MINLTNVESEKILIAQMIIDDSIIDEVFVKCPVDSFSDIRLKNCYELIMSIHNKKEKVDTVSFYTEVKNKKTVSLDLVEEIQKSTFSASNWEFYANKVTDCYKSRQLLKIVSETKEQIKPDNSDELISSITQKLDDIIEINDDVIVYEQLKLMLEQTPVLEDMIIHPENHKGINTGLQSFDNVTGGIFSEWYIISARTSMGKTFLAQQWALNFAMQKKKVAFIELEMTAENINLRNIAMLSNLRINDIKFGGIKSDRSKIQRVEKALQELSSEPISTHYNIVIPKNKRISTIINYVKKAVRKDGVEIVIIDHVGLIKSDNQHATNWESQMEISHKLQELQREINKPLITLSQRARSSEGGKEKGDLSTLRGSGSYEEDADTVMMIEHARVTDKEQKEKVGKDAEVVDCEIYISKSRNGNCGVAKCKFWTAKGRFFCGVE